MARSGGLIGGGVGRRIVEASAKRALGVDLSAEQDTRERLVEAWGEARLLDRLNRRLGWLALNAISRWSQGQDAEPQRRIDVAKRVRAVTRRDSQMLYAVRLRNAFCFGRGVPEPKAPDDDVQEVLEDFWGAKPNRSELTSPTAQWRFGKDLWEQMNVFLVVFGLKNSESLDGRILLGGLQHDQVRNVVRDKGNWRRILYYVVTEYVYEWDFETHAPKPNATTRLVYYEALDGMAELEEEMAAGRTDKLPDPIPPHLLRPGRILHVATNLGREQAFGEPEMRTNLRWASAFNDLLAGQTEKAKAAQQYLMKISVGARTDDQLQDVAMKAVGRRSPLANADLDGLGFEMAEFGQTPPAGRNARPGSQWWENDSVKAEPFSLDSGGQAAKADLESASHAFAAGTNFPAHYYFGDPGSLAGAMAVELPVLKLTDVDQELVGGVFRQLCDLRIARAIEVGLLTERRPPTQEELDAGIEVGPDGLVERDLSYELKMPDPLRRNLPELMSLVGDVAATFDPTGQSEPLNRALLGYALDLLDMSDVPALIDRMFAQRDDQIGGGVDPENPPTDPRSVGPDGRKHNSSNPYGARQQSQVVEAALAELWRRVAEHLDDDAQAELAVGNGSVA